MKRLMSLLLSLALVLALVPASFAASSEQQQAAEALNAIGLFSGTGVEADGSPRYELDRQPTRQEAITMLVKLVGGTEESSKGGWKTPFTDVDDWAKNWVGYAYAKGLTAGTSATTFGANDKTTAAQYLTFVLKALGYDANSDFSWDNTWPLAERVGLSKGEYNAKTTFTRGDMALISHRALSAKMKGTDIPLRDVVFGSQLPADSYFDVHFIDVGQADAALVICDDKTMLIDGGNRADSSLLYSYLKQQGVTHLDYVVATHAHEDHVGGLAGALNYATVGTALCSVTEYNSDVFRNFVSYLAKQGKQIKVPKAGDTFYLGSAQVQVLGPVRKSDDPNNMSLVLRIVYGETSFLFTGDAEREEEQDILAAGYELSSTVLKVGHHGSENSTTYPFLREIMPEYAVISVGEGNSYGHPTEAALSRLRDAGAYILRTDENGLICCSSDGKDVYFIIEKEGPEQAEPEPTGTMVWIPQSGSKYHSHAGCSNMKNPSQVPEAQAIEGGYTPCKKCW